MKQNSPEFLAHLRRIGFKKGEDPRRSKGKPFDKGHIGYMGKLGYKCSKETCLKLSKARIGKSSWNKGLTKQDTRVNQYASKLIGKRKTFEHRLKISLAEKGKYVAPWPIERRKKLSEKKKGPNCHFWKGGITKKHQAIRASLEYGLWREQVFKRDNFTCQRCGKIKDHIEAHHIMAFSKYPEMRFEISNGITLCRLCHKLTDNYGCKINKK